MQSFVFHSPYILPHCTCREKIGEAAALIQLTTFRISWRRGAREEGQETKPTSIFFLEMGPRAPGRNLAMNGEAKNPPPSNNQPPFHACSSNLLFSSPLGGVEGVEEEVLCCDLVLTRCDIILLLARPFHSCFRDGERARWTMPLLV